MAASLARVSSDGVTEGFQPVRTKRYVPLLYRVAGLNALLIVVAVVATIIVLAPSDLPSFRVDEEGAVVVLILIVTVAADVYVVRRFVRPLQTLTALARHVDLSGTAERMPVDVPQSEAGELASTFNAMLARLEDERREATGRVLAAQEAERLRIAQELHDQIGQELTAVLLGLARIEGRVADPLRGEVSDVQDAVRDSLEEVRLIAVDLRPEALDDLGLESALAVLCQRFAERSGLRVTERIGEDLPELPPDAELVIYRIAQESLTNVARHSGASEAELALSTDHDVLTLTVSDAGAGLPPGRPPGMGIRGMRERAMLIGGSLTIGNAPSGSGCVVRLEVPQPARWRA